MFIVLFVIFVVGVQQFVKYKVIVICIIVIEEFVGVIIFCFDKIGIFIINKFIIDKENVKCYFKWDVEGVCFFVVYVFCIENQDVIDGCVVGIFFDF